MIHNIERLKIYRLLEVPQSSTAAFCFSIGIQILIIFSVLVFILERYRGQKIEVIMKRIYFQFATVWSGTRWRGVIGQQCKSCCCIRQNWLFLYWRFHNGNITQTTMYTQCKFIPFFQTLLWLADEIHWWRHWACVSLEEFILFSAEIILPGPAEHHWYSRCSSILHRTFNTSGIW